MNIMEHYLFKGERITLVITVLLSFALTQATISNWIPKTEDPPFLTNQIIPCSVSQSDTEFFISEDNKSFHPSD